MPTEDITRAAVYAVGAGAAAGVALGAMNRAKKTRAVKAHEKVTINDLEKVADDD